MGLISRTRDGQGKTDRIHLTVTEHLIGRLSKPQIGKCLPLPSSDGKLGFNFYQLPKAFLDPKNPRYKMSNDAKAVYALFLDLMHWSKDNGYVDDENRLFISPFINDLQRFLACGRDKASRVIKELVGEGLIERREMMGAPWRIYPLKMGDALASWDLRTLIRSRIEYDELKFRYPESAALLDTIVELMNEALTSDKPDHYIVEGRKVASQAFKAALENLRISNIEQAMSSIEKASGNGKIHSYKPYMLVVLYNSRFTASA
jgi:hypothetical protein